MEELKSWINDSAYTVVFTGAGISTDSGIPDFRSPGGLWSRLAPIDFRDFMASDEMRGETWRRKVLLDQEIGKPEPNKAHYAISQLVDVGKVSKVITQNIDNLHVCFLNDKGFKTDWKADNLTWNSFLKIN